MPRLENKSSYSQLEYNKIKNIIAEECQCIPGKEIAHSLQPLNNKTEIEFRLSLATEMQKLLKNKISFNFSKISDIEKLLLELKHQTYNFEEFQKIYFNLVVANNIYCPQEIENDLPNYIKIINGFFVLPDLEKRFQQIFDAEGEVKDSASSQLASIRQRKRKLRRSY